MLIQLICYDRFCNRSAVTVLRTEHLMTSCKLRRVGVEIRNEVLVLRHTVSAKDIPVSGRTCHR